MSMRIIILLEHDYMTIYRLKDFFVVVVDTVPKVYKHYVYCLYTCTSSPNHMHVSGHAEEPKNINKWNVTLWMNSQ